ncbi:MAG: DinB family protein [Bacteroidota bacterium]|nr:DinB family protein [Bacteroidota bacterium]
MRGFLFYEMKEQLIEAWQINNSKNFLLIDNIDDGAMQKTLSKRGGRTVYLQLIHLHNVRLGWLEVIAKDIFKKYKLIDKEAAYDRNALRAAFDDSATGIKELIDQSWNNEGNVKSFKKGLIPFIGYLISHESHHRGNILLTLKQSGIKLPDTLKWGLWEWDK